MIKPSNLREFFYRSLSFEAEAERFRDAGIRIGADQTTFEHSLMDQALADFPHESRNRALQMARLYASLNCFENSVRDLIQERLEAKHKSDWWKSGVPPKIQTHAESRKQKSLENTWLEGDQDNLLSFADFGHLCQTIIDNWDLFSDLIPSQHWLKQRFDELEQARNYIAHNRFLLPSEFARIEMYLNDWRRQVGL